MSKQNDQIIGVSIAMSRREPFLMNGRKDIDRWNLTAFGFFDEIRLDIINEPHDFSLEKLYDELHSCSDDERKQFHSETQKLFLYCDYSKELYDTLGEYSKGTAKRPFFALFAVKLRRKLTERPDCDQRKCIEGYLQTRKHGKHGEDYSLCVMNSLSIDDVYVMIASDSINIILKLLYDLQNFICNFKCRDNFIPSKLRDCSDCKGKCHRDNYHVCIKEAAKKSRRKLIKIMKEASAEKCFVYNSKLRSEFTVLIARCREHINKCLKSGHHLECDEIVDKFKLPEIFLDKDKARYVHVDFARRCLATVYTLVELPIVMQSHTIIGYNNSYFEKYDIKNLPSDLKAKFDADTFLTELELRLSPGVGLFSFVEDLKAAVNKNEDLEELKLFLDNSDSQNCERTIGNLLLTTGTCDFSWRGKMNATLLVQFCHLEIWNWRPSASNSIEINPIESSSFHFFLEDDISKAPVGIVDSVELSKQIRKEEVEIAQFWVDKQQNRAIGMFSRSSKSAIYKDYKDEFPLLHSMINEISFLNVQGCRRFFFALTWNEFKTARAFFGKFYKRIESEFAVLCDLKGARTDYALMLYLSMLQFKDVMSSVFNERMMLDMSMRKNTRTGIYATGAYEVVLRQYRNWIRELHALLNMFTKKACGVEVNMNFLLVPKIEAVPSSTHLLQMSKVNDDNCASTFVIYRTSFDKMMEFDKTLALYVHEVGHYVGIVRRERRVKIYLSMVAAMLAESIARNLCRRSYVKVSVDVVEDQKNKLVKSLYNYFEAERKSMINHEKVHLDFVKRQCIIWYGNFLNSVHSDFPVSQAMQASLKEFVNLYDVLNATPLLTKDGVLFIELLDQDRVDNIVDICVDIVRESWADALMLLVLNLSEDKFFDIMVSALESRSKALFTNTNKHFKSDSDERFEGDTDISLDVIRSISAILVLKFKCDYGTDEFKAVSDRKTLSAYIQGLGLEGLIDKRIAALDLKGGNAAEYLSDALKRFNYPSNKNWDCRINVYKISMYLFYATKDILDKINDSDDGIKLRVTKMSELYKKIDDTENRMAQLNEFLNLDWESVN